MTEQFKTRPGFPFERYFEDIQQFLSAQEYWAKLLHTLPAFMESDWVPTARPVDVADDMYTGRVLDVTNWKTRQQISLQTFSLAGDINMALRENGPADPADIPDGIDPETRARIEAGIDEATLRQSAAANYSGFMSWSQESQVFDPAAQTEAHQIVPFDTLFLTAEISPRVEPLAVDALTTFLSSGSKA